MKKVLTSAVMIIFILSVASAPAETGKDKNEPVVVKAELINKIVSLMKENILLKKQVEDLEKGKKESLAMVEELKNENSKLITALENSECELAMLLKDWSNEEMSKMVAATKNDSEKVE